LPQAPQATTTTFLLSNEEAPAVLDTPATSDVVRSIVQDPLSQPQSASEHIYTSIGQQIQQQGQLVTGDFPRTAGPNAILYRADQSGKVTHYEVYDATGNPVI
jgi:hypothetical protein